VPAQTGGKIVLRRGDGPEVILLLQNSGHPGGEEGGQGGAETRPIWDAFSFYRHRGALRIVPQHCQDKPPENRKKDRESLWKISRSKNDHSACMTPSLSTMPADIGAVVDIKGRKSHQTVSDALSIVERLEHREMEGIQSRAF